MVCTLAAVMSMTIVSTSAMTPRCAETPPPAGDYMYTFVTTEESGSTSSGTVRVHAGRTRIDMDDRKHSDEYMLLTDNGTRMMSVHPDRKEVDEISSPSFEHIVGTSLRMVSPMVKFNVQNSKISFARVGTGKNSSATRPSRYG